MDWHQLWSWSFTPVWQKGKTKCQNVFRANSYVCRSYRGKTGRGDLFASSPSWIGLSFFLEDFSLVDCSKLVFWLSAILFHRCVPRSFMYSWLNLLFQGSRSAQLLFSWYLYLSLLNKMPPVPWFSSGQLPECPITWFSYVCKCPSARVP